MKYRKKPVVVDVVQWDGSNLSKIEEFLGKCFLGYEVLSDTAWQVGKGIPFTEISIKTIDSVAKAVNGDYIIKDEQGEFYPCKPDIFEETYELAEYKGAIKMNFEEVLPLLKQGKKALRGGWNGKGMFVVRQKGYPEGIKCNKQTAEAWNLNEGDLFKVHPYLQIKNADGTHAMWVPSIGDIFAEDWEIVE